MLSASRRISNLASLKYSASLEVKGFGVFRKFSISFLAWASSLFRASISDWLLPPGEVWIWLKGEGDGLVIGRPGVGGRKGDPAEPAVFPRFAEPPAVP